MSWHAIETWILAIGLASGVAAATSHVAMLRAVRKKLGDDEAERDLLRVVQVLYEVHRSLYPQSSLRKVHLVSFVLFMPSMAGLIVVGKLPRW